MLSETQRRFVELEKRKADYKAFMEELNDATEALIREIGVNGYFQDDEGVVYKTVIPEGTFVAFKKFGYVRTRRMDEKRGELSLKEAEEAGFKVEKK